MAYIERLNTRRARVAIIAVIWVLMAPIIYMFIAEWQWWTVLLLGLAMWGSLDYVRRGDMFTAVDHSVSHHVWSGEDARHRLGGKDPDGS